MMLKGQWVRLSSVALIVSAAFFGLGVRLSSLHLGQNEKVRSKINRTRHFEKRTAGTRGRIVDRNNEIMALDLSMRHIAVDPDYLYKNTEPEKWPLRMQGLAARLAYLLELDVHDVRKALENVDSRFVYLKKYVMPEVAEQISGLKERCVVVEETKSRHYPKGALMSHVVGFSNLEGIGSSGVELSQNQYLNGREGIRVGKKDGQRRELYTERSLDVAPAQGMSVQLTVDQFLQDMVEQALETAMETQHARGAWATIMDTRSGAILAMASKPDYDLNKYRQTPSDTMMNRVIGYSYEPGSTVKPLITAAVLEEGLATPSEMIDCTKSGVWYHKGKPLRDFHAYGTLSVADVLKKSSNIGTAKLALRLGEDRLYKYYKAFGFAQRSGLDLPGEEYGILHSTKSWSSLSLTRICIGHEMMTTSLQVLNAINAIANEGFLMRPHIVASVVDPDGRPVYVASPEVISRPISRETASRTRALMARITGPKGTGRRAAMEKYIVAGKTGTAEKVINGQYSKSKNIASFVGFLPADRPEISMIVVVDEPTLYRTGGQAAAPVFKEIAAQAVRYLNIAPSAEGAMARMETQL